MSNGPIEFMGERFVDEKEPSEYGGKAGLIQPSPEEVGLEAADGMPIGHVLEPSEVSGVMRRAAGVPLEGAAQYEEDPYVDGVVDPASGRVLADDEVGEDVTGHGGQLSDLQP